MNIYGKKVILRFLEEDDLEKVREMTNDPNQERMIVGWSFPAARKHQENWYQRILSDQNSFRFAIEYNGIFVGISTLTDIDWKNRKADHGIRLTLDAPKKQGIATDAVYATMRYAFEELNLNKLCGSILEYNIYSWKLYSKCGWKSEGVYKQSVYKNGKFYDESPVAILREEYEEWKKSNPNLIY